MNLQFFTCQGTTFWLVTASLMRRGVRVRLKEHAWKACIGGTRSEVRILSSPPANTRAYDEYRKPFSCAAFFQRFAKRKGAFFVNAPLSGNQTPGSNRYRCFLSDLTGFSAQPPSGFPPVGKGFPTAFMAVSSTIHFPTFQGMMKIFRFLPCHSCAMG